MALRFLADHCVSNSTVQTLREANHEVLRLRDVLPVESADAIVITKAQEIDAILLSLNGDFADIVNYPPKNYKGIVSVQRRNHSEIVPKLIARLTAYLNVHTTMDHTGSCSSSRLIVSEFGNKGPSAIFSTSASAI
jgi:predicted nuclease of predicted toxin-antitoxin system